MIDPSALETMLIEVAQLFSEKEKEVIAIDGKTLFGSKSLSKDRKAVHILNAWSCQNRVCLGQIKVNDKTNEITAIGPPTGPAFYKRQNYNNRCLEYRTFVFECVKNLFQCLEP